MSRVGAFFDVDRTIVSCNTGRLFLRDLQAARRDLVLPDAARAGLDGQVPPVADRPAVGGHPPGRRDGGPARARVRRHAAGGWVEKDVLPLVVPGARDEIEKHRAEGHVLAILSTSPMLRHRAARRGAGHRRGDVDPVRGRRTGSSRAACSAPPASAAARSTGPRISWRASSSTSRRAGSTRTRTPTCRCWSGSATRSSSTRIRACKRIAKRRGWPVQDWRQADAAAAAGEVRA